MSLKSSKGMPLLHSLSKDTQTTNVRPVRQYSNKKLEKLKKQLKTNDDEIEELPLVSNGTVKEIKAQQGIKLIDKIKLKRKPQQSFLITMKFSNGTRRTFVITTTDEIFTYKGQSYYLYYQNAYYDLSHHQYHLEFFDDYAVPIDRKIVLKSDDDAETPELARAFFSVTPSNLKSLIKMEYIKALAESQELSKYLKMLVTISLIAGALTIYIVYKLYSMTGKI